MEIGTRRGQKIFDLIMKNKFDIEDIELCICDFERYTLRVE